MAIQTFTQNNFIKMPWKNKGGITTELYSLNLNSSVVFRLSVALVENDGPFSNFPGIDRVLILLKGKGFQLLSENKATTLKLNSPPFYFKGEASIKCILIEGPCIDFNIMTDRQYAKSKVTVEKTLNNSSIILKAEYDFKFIYDNEIQELYKLDLGDEIIIEGKNKTLIIVDVTKL